MRDNIQYLIGLLFGRKFFFIEFDSMINLRPSLGNNSREVEDKEIQQKFLCIVKSKITE